MNKTEAVRKAIEALEDAAYEWSLYVEVDTAPLTLSEHLAPRITAIQEALANPVLKPCRSPYCECAEGKCTHPGCYDARHESFEFPEAQPEKHQSFCDSLNIMLTSMPPKPASCNCKQKDLEQPRQLAQEPVARIGMISEEHFTDVCRSAGGNSNTPLYNVPPKRKLIELTDKEIMEIDSTYYRPMGPLEFAKLLQIKLKEKNNA